MQTAKAKKITVLTIATMFGLGMAKSLIVDNQFPPFRFFAANGFAAFALAAAADIEPEVAGPFALLIFTVIIMEEGPPLFSALDANGAITGAKSTSKPKRQRKGYGGVTPREARRIFARAVPTTMTPPNKATPHIP